MYVSVLCRMVGVVGVWLDGVICFMLQLILFYFPSIVQSMYLKCIELCQDEKVLLSEYNVVKYNIYTLYIYCVSGWMGLFVLCYN